MNNKIKTILLNLFLLFFSTFLNLCPLSVRAQTQGQVPTTVEAPPDLQDPPKSSIQVEKRVDQDSETRKRLYLTPTIGIEHQENLKERIQNIPKEVELKGDYGSFSEAAFDPETGILRITPQKVGVGTITIHDKKNNSKVLYEIRLDVKKSSLDKVAREIRSLLGDIEGLQIKILNNKVVIDGQILLPRDMSRIGNVVMQYQDQAVSLVSLSPLAQKKIAEIIERDINNPEINVRAINDKFILEGIANSPDEKARAEIIAKTYVPDIILDQAEEKFIKKRKFDLVINLITIRESAPPAPKKMIQLVIHYVELSKDYTNSFQFRWMPNLKDGSSVQFGQTKGETSTFSSITGIIDSFIPKLNWLKTHDHARILESTSIIVEDGQKGEMKSVSNIPYSVTQMNGVQSTQKEQVGISSTIQPFIISANSDSIKLDMNFAVSQLLGVTAAGPLTSENNVHTNITVRSGQSAAVAGLISNNNSTGYNHLPGDLPANPIVTLLNSKAYQRKQSQFVVFITPIIKSSASSGVEKIKKKFRLRD